MPAKAPSASPAPSAALPAAAPAAAPSDSGSVEFVIAPMEIHLERPPDYRRVLSWLVDAVPFAALFALLLRAALYRLPHPSPLDLSGYVDLAFSEAAEITLPVLAGTLVLFAVYHALSHGLAGATLGKRLLGLRLVARDGRRPGPGRAALRAVLALVSLLLLGLGVLLALFTPSSRALHDFLAGTWVVEAP